MTTRHARADLSPAHLIARWVEAVTIFLMISGLNASMRSRSSTRD